MRIIIKSVIVIALLLNFQVVQAQNISDVFLKIPVSIAPTLSDQQRFEILEYYKSNKADSVKNRYGNYVKVLYLDTINQHLTAKTTENNLIDIKLFKTDENEVLVGVINTVLSAVEVSSIQFFDLNWRISKIQFPIPTVAKWINDNTLGNIDINQNWFKNIAEQKFVKLEFSKTDLRIIVNSQILNFVSQENKKELIDLINNKPLVYELKGNEFVEVEK